MGPNEPNIHPPKSKFYHHNQAVIVASNVEDESLVAHIISRGIYVNPNKKIKKHGKRVIIITDSKLDDIPNYKDSKIHIRVK